jgi:hypothetical protein
MSDVMPSFGGGPRSVPRRHASNHDLPAAFATSFALRPPPFPAHSLPARLQSPPLDSARHLARAGRARPDLCAMLRPARIGRRLRLSTLLLPVTFFVLLFLLPLNRRSDILLEDIEDKLHVPHVHHVAPGRAGRPPLGQGGADEAPTREARTQRHRNGLLTIDDGELPYLRRHPIEVLVAEAKKKAAVQEARVPVSLDTAIALYQELNGGQFPPLGFDKWFVVDLLLTSSTTAELTLSNGYAGSPFVSSAVSSHGRIRRPTARSSRTSAYPGACFGSVRPSSTTASRRASGRSSALPAGGQFRRAILTVELRGPSAAMERWPSLRGPSRQNRVAQGTSARSTTRVMSRTLTVCKSQTGRSHFSSSLLPLTCLPFQARR